MDVIKDIESKGWKVIRTEGIGVYAIRKRTGKLGFFTRKDVLSGIEIVRIWCLEKYHPFIYESKGGKIIYYDYLSNEYVNFP